jgi:hypothetical protein
MSCAKPAWSGTVIIANYAPLKRASHVIMFYRAELEGKISWITS